MNVVTIKIAALGDPPLFPELTRHPISEGVLNHVAILEAGTTTGRTSMGIYITLPTGDIAVAQVTAEQFLMIASAAKGAMERFGR